MTEPKETTDNLTDDWRCGCRQPGLGGDCDGSCTHPPQENTALALVRAQRDYERAKAAAEVARAAEDAARERLDAARAARERWEEAELLAAWAIMERLDGGCDADAA